MKSKRTESLAEWRKTNFGETQKCLEVAIRVRDAKETGDKERIEAVKAIARMLGSLAPERIATPKGTAGDETKELTLDEQTRLDNLLHDANPT